MKKIITIFAIASLILVSCSTSTKTTSTASTSEVKANEKKPLKERAYSGEGALKKQVSPNLKNVSVADSKRAPMVTKQQTIQKVK